MTDQERCEEVCRRFNAAGYYSHLGLRAESGSPGSGSVRLPFDERLTQLYGGVHGGALMSAADAAISIAVATTISEDEAVATVELSMQFLEPVGRRDVVAEGRLTKRGKRLAFGECALSAGGQVVARAQGIWRIGSKKKVDRARTT